MTAMHTSDNRPVFIRGKAVACALGEELDTVVDAMHAGRINMTSMALSITDPDECRPYYMMPGPLRERWQNVESRFYGVLLETVAKAVADAGLSEEEMEEMSIFLGSTSMNIPIFEAGYAESEARFRDYFTQAASGFGVIADKVADRFGIRGPCYTFTTACTSSANGLLYAAAMIEQADQQRALVIGYDMFNLLGFYGFESLKLLSGSVYRPFDKRRDGIVMGEACGAVILDTQPRTPTDFRILGGANACDTNNVALHDTEGHVVAGVMAEALDTCRVDRADVTAIKAHATGSYHNDLTEANAIYDVFGRRYPPTTGLKPFIGHTVGACGVVELILFTESIRAGFLPATVGFEVADEALAIAPLSAPGVAEKGTFMLNYFGFGGNCTTLMVTNED
jgi:3-oxoacyl-[acyl-carrier-protein] synthase-1